LKSVRIFINYRREDTQGYTGRLYDALAARFLEDHIWMDIDSLRPGVDWPRELNDAIESCDVLLAVIGDRWLSVADGSGVPRLNDPDDHCRQEIEAALDRPNVTVIPVMVGGASMPGRSQLPPSLARLADRQNFELSPRRWKADVADLIRTLEEIEARQEGQTRTTRTPRTQIAAAPAAPASPMAPAVPPIPPQAPAAPAAPLPPMPQAPGPPPVPQAPPRPEPPRFEPAPRPPRPPRGRV
jgi:hypothetical protein